MQLPPITGEFRIGSNPELRFTPAGKAVCSMRVVAAPRRKNAAGEYEDGDPSWFEVVAWEKLAENMVESFDGMVGKLMFVSGTLAIEEWEGRDGAKGKTAKITARTLGPSITWDPARTVESEGSRPATNQTRRAVDRSQAASQEPDPFVSSTAGQWDEPPPF